MLNPFTVVNNNQDMELKDDHNCFTDMLKNPNQILNEKYKCSASLKLKNPTKTELKKLNIGCSLQYLCLLALWKRS